MACERSYQGYTEPRTAAIHYFCDTSTFIMFRRIRTRVCSLVLFTVFISQTLIFFSQHMPNSPLFQTVYPLLIEYQVQLVITGHMHVYERVFYDNTTTVINNTYVNIHSPVIVVQGTGGSFDHDKWVDPQPWWSKSRALEYGYGRLTVSIDANQQRLHYEYLAEHDRSTYDQFSIVI